MDKSAITDIVRDAGATAVGIAHVATVDDSAREAYRQWIASGRSAPLAYMDRYHEVRDNPGLLLEGAKSIIVAAFSYFHPSPPPK